MRKTFIATMMIFALLGLAACSAASSAVPAAEEAASNAQAGASATLGPLTMDYENALSPQLQLAIGTLMLDGTPNAIDAAEAGKLLPLWKAINSLSGDSSISAEEVSALYTQIEETMSADQIQAIAGMQLTREDMTTAGEKLGIELGFGGRFGNLTPEMQATMEAARESGQFPQGGFGGEGGFPGGGPGGGGGFGGGAGGGFEGGGLTPEQQATAVARREAGGDGAGFPGGALIPSAVLNAVIEYLGSVGG